MLSLAVAAAMAIPVSAETVKTLPFHIGESTFCFFPNGYMQDASNAFLYRIENNIDGKYGDFFDKVAIFYGPDRFADFQPIAKSTLVPKFIFCDGEYLPVKGISGCFSASTAPEVFLQDCVSYISDNSFKGADEITSLILPVELRYLGTNALGEMKSLKNLYFRSPLPPDCKVEILNDFSEICSIGRPKDFKLQDSYITPFGTVKDMIHPNVFIPKGSQSFYANNQVTYEFRFNTDVNWGMQVAEYEPELMPLLNPSGDKGLEYGSIGNFEAELLKATAATGNVTVPATVTSDSYETGVSLKENPASVKGIGYRAFTGSGAENVEISDGCVYIKDEAFSGSELKSLVIPPSVRFVGYEILSDSPSVESVTVLLPTEGEPPIYNSRAFYGVSPTATLYIDTHSKMVDVKGYPFRWFNRIVDINSGVESIIDDESLCISAKGGVGVIVLDNSSDNEADVCITSVSGILLYNGKVASGTTEISAQPGIYILRQEGITTKLIVK